jgi:transposase
VRAYRFRAYTSKTTTRVLKTQLKTACKLYNTLLHAEKEEYERNRHTMNKTELRQLALDLRKQNQEFQALHSQVAQQVADRFYEARQRFFEGLANKPRKRSLTNTFLWCTLNLVGSFLIGGRLDKVKTKRRRLDST